MSWHRVWWIVAALLLLWVWAAYYRAPAATQILQTTLPLFEVDALLQKQPVVVADRVADVGEIRRAWFGANFVREASAVPDRWARVGAKWAVLYPREDAELLICPATCRTAAGAPVPDQTLVAVPLKAHQLLILPFHYYFYTASAGVDMLLVNDWVSWALP